VATIGDEPHERRRGSLQHGNPSGEMALLANA
jgi:hypothetical protein